MTEIHIISISVITSALVTWFCFYYYLWTFRENPIRNGSQISPMYCPPPPQKRKEPMSFTSEQVNQIVKSRKKDKIKSLEEDVVRWRNMYFKSEEHISELAKRNSEHRKEIDTLKEKSEINHSVRFAFDPNKLKIADSLYDLKDIWKNHLPKKQLNQKNIKDVKMVRVDENNNILEIYSLNKQRNEKDKHALIKEIKQDLKKVHDVLWDTPFDSKISERFISAMNKQNSAILKLIELCKH